MTFSVRALVPRKCALIRLMAFLEKGIKMKIQQVMLVRKLFVQGGKSATLVEAQFNGKISRQSNMSCTLIRILALSRLGQNFR